MRLPRPLEFWAAADRRATLWLQLLIVQSFLLAVSLAANYKLITKPPLVYRVACDGIPAALTLNEVIYSEPQEAELRSFATHVTTKLMRLDSYSIVNDVVDVTKWMTPDATARWQSELQDLVKGVEEVKRRANIDPQKLEIAVDKSSWPWRAQVKGERRILTSQDEPVKVPPQPFAVSFDIVTTDRSPLNTWGLLISAFRTEGSLLQVAKN